MKRFSAALFALFLSLFFSFPLSLHAESQHLEHTFFRQGLSIHVGTYCLGPDGKPLTGPVTIDGTLYFFGPDGLLQYGFANGYLTDECGRILTGRQTIGDTEYWFDETGKLMEGPVAMDGGLVLFEGGQRLSGEVVYEGRTVLLSEEGQIIDGQVGNAIYSDGAVSGKINPVNWLYQSDPRWSHVNVSGYDDIGTTGCLPAVAAMAINALTGSEYTPVDLGKFLHESGAYGVETDEWISRGCLAKGWGDIANNYPVTVSPLFTEEDIKAWIDEGGLVAFCATPSPTNCHEVIVAGYDGKGNALLYDPADSGSPYWMSFSKLMPMASSLWYNQYMGSGIIGLK